MPSNEELIEVRNRGRIVSTTGERPSPGRSDDRTSLEQAYIAAPGDGRSPNEGVMRRKVIIPAKGRARCPHSRIYVFTPPNFAPISPCCLLPPALRPLPPKYIRSAATHSAVVS